MKTTIYKLSINKDEICYLQWIIESYGGMATVRTINPSEGEVEISICPGCQDDILSLLTYLKEEGSIHVRKQRFAE